MELDSDSRFGLKHPPTSVKNIVSTSPLHSYMCVFNWLMLNIYHLDAGLKKWQPTSQSVKTSMKRMNALLSVKTGLQIDIPSSAGGTTTTGNVARECFSNKRDFINWATSTLREEDREIVKSYVIPCSLF